MISKESVISLAEHLSVAELSGEAVLLNARSGQYFGVNELGAAIIRLLDRPRTVSDIEGVIGNVYAVDDHSLRTDLVDFLQALEDNELILST